MDLHELFSNQTLIKLIAAIVELLIGFSLGPLLKSWITRINSKKVDAGVLTFTGSAISIFVRFLAIVIALGQIGVDTSVIVGAFSAVGLGVSLALKESMANVAGGLQILITRPFKVGDYISCNGQEGTCQEIELMFTTLSTANLQEVVIPNSMIVSNMVVNYTQYPERRLVVSVPVMTDGNFEAFRQDIQEYLDTQPDILKNPAPKTVIGGFLETGNGMKINIVCYALNANYWDMLYDVNEKAHELLVKNGLSQPVERVELTK